MPDQELGRNDLAIFVTDAQGAGVAAAEVFYALFLIKDGKRERMGPERRTPVRPAVGEYYASLLVPPTAEPGQYQIEWRVCRGQDDVASIVQDFHIVPRTHFLDQCHPFEPSLSEHEFRSTWCRICRRSGCSEATGRPL